MGLFTRKTATPSPDPTRTTWSVELTGTCADGHQVSTTTQINARNGSMGSYCADGSCSCGADVHLTGWVG